MIKKVSSKKKKELVKAIKNPNRYFRLDFGRYGGEVAMGEITKEQYTFWEGKDEEFAEHMRNIEFEDPEVYNKGVPVEARIDKPFYDFEDICHLSGPEWSEGQIMTITEVDKDGNSLKNENGGYLEDEQHELGTLVDKGAEIDCTAEHLVDSESCKDKYYFFGQYFNKGGWYTEGLIKTDHRGFDFKKLKIDYENADGFRVFSHITYNGEEMFLEEDSTGKSSCFYVMEGDDV